MIAARTESAGDLAVAAVAKNVDVVVVSHNSCGHIERCLTALNGDAEHVIVVDSASADASVETVREQFATVELVALSENRGFGAAANRGIVHVRSPYVLLLNADAWPLPGAVAELVSAAEDDPGAGIVAPGLVNLDGSAQRSVFGYPTSPWLLAAWASFPTAISRSFQAWRLIRPRPEVVTGNDFPAGAALLIRKRAFDEVGGFDEAFFMYSEETDLCARLREHGWRIALCRAATFMHVGGASTALAPDAMYEERIRSHIRFIAKYRGPARADRARSLLAGALRLRSLLARGDARRRRRAVSDWLASSSLETLLS